MVKLKWVPYRLWLVVLVVISLGTFLAGGKLAPESVASFLAQAPKPLEKPPQGQMFVGAKNCSSCHLDQFLDWRGTKHAKAYDDLPAKYQDDKTCLKCHTTGYGDAGGFQSKAATPGLVGTSCESCHGPGSKHAEIAKSFGTKKLDKDEEAYVRSTIYRMQPKNVCVDCHLTRAHKKHPDYVK